MPIKWMALECIHYRKFTHQSDVWSYGRGHRLFDFIIIESSSISPFPYTFQEWPSGSWWPSEANRMMASQQEKSLTSWRKGNVCRSLRSAPSTSTWSWSNVSANAKLILDPGLLWLKKSSILHTSDLWQQGIKACEQLPSSLSFLCNIWKTDLTPLAKTKITPSSKLNTWHVWLSLIQIKK